MGIAPRYPYSFEEPAGPTIRVAGRAYPVSYRLTWRNFFRDMDADEWIVFGGGVSCILFVVGMMIWLATL